MPNANEEESIMNVEGILEYLLNSNNNIISGIDQNFNLLKLNSHVETYELFNMFFTASLVPWITKPASATLIDNIYVKLEDRPPNNSDILLSDISYHFPQPKNTCFSRRNLNTHACQQIKNVLGNINWDHLFTLETDKANSSCVNTIKGIIELFAIRHDVVIPKKYVLTDTWVAQVLFHIRQTIPEETETPPIHQTLMPHKEYRNLGNKIKRLAKHNYFQTQPNKYKGDIKSTLDTLRHLLSKMRDKSEISSSFNMNNELILWYFLSNSANIKFLGIYLDERLIFNQHIEYCRKKISSSTYAIH